jgi:hypothetical protein
MAAKARLSCPVRCAAISPGPTLPILPQGYLSCPVRCAAISPGPAGIKKESPQSARQKMQNSLWRNNLRKMSPVKSVDLAYNSAQFESIDAGFELFREQFETIRDNWRYFETSRTLASPRSKQHNLPILPRLPKPPHHSKLNAVRCPLNAVIMQNEPNFQKTKTNLNPCSEMTYEGNCPSDDPKNEPKRTQFSIGACLGLVRHSCGVTCPPKPRRRRISDLVLRI